MNWWNSLRVKIVAWFFIPTAIILSAVAWFTFYSYQKVIGDLAINQDWAVVQSKTQPLFQVYYDVSNHILLRILLQVDIQKEGSVESRAQKILDQTGGLDIYDGGIYFTDQQGKMIKTWPEQQELLGQNWSDTPHFLFLTDHPGRAAYNDLRTIESSGKGILCLSLAMNDSQGAFVGTAYYCFTVYPPTRNVLYEAFNKVYNDLDLDASWIILDGNQRVIFSPDLSLMGKDLSGEAYLQKLFQGQNQSIRFRTDTEDVLVSYAPMYTFTTNVALYNLVKVESWANVMRPSLPYRQLLLFLLSMGVIVPVLVTAYGVRHIIHPIQELIRASAQVTAGQFNHHIDVKTGDEIEALANQFNLMSAELADSYASLEKKVADRTRELATLNAILSVASRSLDIKEILEAALNETIEQINFDAGAAFKFEPYPTPPRVIACQNLEPTTAVDLLNSYTIVGGEPPVIYPEEAITFSIEDFQDEQLREQLSQFDFQLLVYIPLSTKGRKLGFFVLGKHESNQLSPEEMSLLSSIGKQVGVAMENARLYEQAEQAAIASERHRLARELHDAVTQTLFSANLVADVIPRIWRRDPEEGMQNLEELRQLTRGALAEMRTLLLEMRPESLARADIKSLVTQLADAFIGRVRVPVSLHLQGECELAHDVKLAFYRVAQEALNNIAKHSGARHVEIYLDCHSDHMKLLIKDDGLGFDPGAVTPEHLGITIMRERASSIGASLLIESQINLGTSIELDWELAGEEGDDE